MVDRRNIIGSHSPNSHQPREMNAFQDSVVVSMKISFLICTFFFFKGCRNGKWIEYYENGQTKSIEYYYTPYDPVVYKVGNWTYYNEDGTIDRFEEH